MNNHLPGFTLIELITVIAIIGVLATIGINTFPAAFAKARDSQRLDDAKKITTAVQVYYNDNNAYPPASGCNPGWCNSGAGGSSQTTWVGDLVSTYLPFIPQDPKDLSSPDLLYYYTTSGDDYCLQVSQEKDATASRNYSSTSGSGANQVWKLRFGPSGPAGGICGTR